MGSFNTQVLRPVTSQIHADGPLNMSGHRIVNLGRARSGRDAVNLLVLLALVG